MKDTSIISPINIRGRLYSDPELSHSGRAQMDSLRPAFLKKIKGDRPIVCASGLLRAQQTAYGLTHADNIYIVPHICESGYGLDNMPLSKSKQDVILKEVCDEDIIPRRNFDYYRSTHISNFTKFKQWFGEHWSVLAKKDPSRLFICFSHGRFIKNILRTLMEVSKIPDVKNFECHEFAFTVENDSVIDVKYVRPFEYADLSKFDKSLDCDMDTCRKLSCLHWNTTRVPASKRCLVLKSRSTRKKARR